MQSKFSETDLEAKLKWIYAVVPLSVGPVGPRGGIYSSTEDVLCRVNFRKMIWRPNNRGYMQLCLCLWALSLFFKYTLYTTYPIIEYITPPGKQLWIFAVMLMSVGPVGPGGGIYSIVEDVVCKVYFQQNRFGAK